MIKYSANYAYTNNDFSKNDQATYIIEQALQRWWIEETIQIEPKINSQMNYSYQLLLKEQVIIKQ